MARDLIFGFFADGGHSGLRDAIAGELMAMGAYKHNINDSGLGSGAAGAKTRPF